MSFKCKLGFHSWEGCKCLGCGKKRDEQHDWDGCKCIKCGSIRDQNHNWKEKKCTMCGKGIIYSYEYILSEVKKVLEEQDEVKQGNICLAIVELGGNCLTRLTEIALDKTQMFYTRRLALKIASGFRGEQLENFIRTHCLAGKTKAKLSQILGSDQESQSNMALFVTGEEILNTPDFYERFVIDRADCLKPKEKPLKKGKYKTNTLGDKLTQLSTEDISNKYSYDAWVEGWECIINYPKTWLRNELNNNIIIKPDNARIIFEDGKPFNTPGLTLVHGGYDISKNKDEIKMLNDFRDKYSIPFKGFNLVESEILKLNGINTLIMYFNFQRDSGNWSSITTIRLKKGSVWIFDVSGLKDDIKIWDAPNTPLHVLAKLEIVLK